MVRLRMRMGAKPLIMRAAALSYDGLISTASLMMGVASVVPKDDAKSVILAGVAALVAGACGAAVREFVSVLSDNHIDDGNVEEDMNENRWLNSIMAAVASGFAFVVGSVVPLMAAALTISYCHHLRMVVAAAAATMGLLGFGGLSGVFVGRAARPHPQYYRMIMVMKSSFRVLVGGWIAISITFLSTKYLFTASYYNASPQRPN